MKISETLINRLQLMAIVAMLLTLFTGHTQLFVFAMLTLSGLKLYSYYLFKRTTDAVFTIIYLVMLAFITMER